MSPGTSEPSLLARPGPSDISVVIRQYHPTICFTECSLPSMLLHTYLHTYKLDRIVTFLHIGRLDAFPTAFTSRQTIGRIQDGLTGKISWLSARPRPKQSNGPPPHLAN